MSTEEFVIRTVVGISVLVFVGKILGGLFQRIKIPAVIGEILAGVIFGPFAFGGIIIILGGPLVELNETITTFAEIGAIIILFSAGLESTFAEFRASGVPSFVIGIMGVIAPFFLGYVSSLYLGYDWPIAMLVGAALTATSIAITARVLEDMGQSGTIEAKIMINAAVIDDVLGLAILAIVTSVAQAGVMIGVFDIAFTAIKAMAIWFIMLIVGVYVLPRFIAVTTLWKNEGTVEAAATASCFGFAAIAVAFGLSPIVGAFAAGMAIASSHVIGRVKEYIEKLKMIFGPLFFAVLGASLDPTQVLNVSVVVFIVILSGAMLSKIAGCGIPASLFLKDADKGFRIGLGMASRGEVGFIIAGIGLLTGIIGPDVYAALLTIIMATTIISPILLERAFRKSILKEIYTRRIRRRRIEEGAKAA
jgi:Kef-type K+ transport system membrane component KefB